MDLFTFFTPKNDTFYISSNSSIRQVLEKFDYYKFSVVSLVDEEGKFCGTISQGDILRYIKNVCNFDISKAETTNVMNIEKYRPYKAINIKCSIEEAEKLALEQNFIPVVDDRGMYIGILKRKTILENLLSNMKGKKYEQK